MSNQARRSFLRMSAIVALAVMMTPAAFAQQSGTGGNPPGTEQNVQWTVVEARQKCVQQVMAQYPGDPETDTSLRTDRERAYRVCAAKAGIRP